MLLQFILRGNIQIIIIFVFIFIYHTWHNTLLSMSFSIHSSVTFSEVLIVIILILTLSDLLPHACMCVLYLCVYTIESLLNSFRLLILVCNFPFSLKTYKSFHIIMQFYLMLLNNCIAYNVDTPSFMQLFFNFWQFQLFSILSYGKNVTLKVS